MRTLRSSLTWSLPRHRVGEPATARPATIPRSPKLERALPAGWTLLATDTELVIRHDRPVLRRARAPPRSGRRAAGHARAALSAASRSGSAKQLADAHAQNAQADAAVHAVRERYGKPTPGRQAEAFARDLAAAQSQHVHLPLCALGESSLFDGDETYSPLKIPLDPPKAGQECKSIVAIVKAQCGA